MARVLGIGGVFIKSSGDHNALAEWYQKHLGIELNSHGSAVFETKDETSAAWVVAEKDSKWFSPSESSFMINYRIDNMEEMISQLKAAGVEIQKGPETYDYGKFAWIMDPDGNKVELWEPVG